MYILGSLAVRDNKRVTMVLSDCLESSPFFTPYSMKTGGVNNRRADVRGHPEYHPLTKYTTTATMARFAIIAILASALSLPQASAGPVAALGAEGVCLASQTAPSLTCGQCDAAGEMACTMCYPSHCSLPMPGVPCRAQVACPCKSAKATDCITVDGRPWVPDGRLQDWRGTRGTGTGCTPYGVPAVAGAALSVRQPDRSVRRVGGEAPTLGWDLGLGLSAGGAVCWSRAYGEHGWVLGAVGIITQVTVVSKPSVSCCLR